MLKYIRSLLYNTSDMKEVNIMVLSCNNISKSFGTTEILKGVSFHINDREKAAIVGINGAGKSTLLKIIIGELLLMREM